ncbi:MULTISPECIES: ABC transporter substrate-binding protein [Streptomyces]|uniref:ABC-transporter (Substrate binding) n=1 Tax=Streptomyces olivaceus TaxID=47716 RepID=A0A2U8T8P1_STROV|nr:MULTISPECIES: ABC transporter substrate-binding protein [Streptomyces]AWM72907.1 ABC-transporter (substrate binding) [Streptomyces olivaceus]UOG79500.1 ABC transporter substrate-binding protein [Streptomyces sp. CB09030]GHI94368.1 ABC transporter substrate-binding protein [Streptomyces olivaceus]
MSQTPAARPTRAPGRRPSTTRVSTAAALLTLLLASCGSGGEEIPEDTRAADLGRQDVVSAVHEDAALSAALPAQLRESGKLRIGSGIGVPPVAFSPEDGGPPRGVDIDVSEAVARVLGLRVERKHVSGASLITGLNAGRYDVGTANLAVTEERKQALDFVLYVTDGTGFAVREDSELKKVDDVGRLCGLRVGTGTGTTFEEDLEAASEQCAADGGKPITISTYPDAAAHFLALRQGRVDVLMTTSSVLRYAATQQPDLRYLNEIERKNVGLAVKKGSPLAEPLKNAVNQLIEDGTYARILKKWQLEPAKVKESVVNPPAKP